MKTLAGVPEGQDAFVLKESAIEAQRRGGAALHIALDETRIHTLVELLRFFAPDIEVLEYPAWDCLPYDRVSPQGDIIGRRVATLAALAARAKSDIRKPLVVLTSVNAATQRALPREASESGSLIIKKGTHIGQDAVVRALAEHGYARTDVVREGGEFAVRGGIIDVFVAGAENPVRIDFFGDEVETLKSFDAATQLSLGDAPELRVGGVAEVLLSEGAIERFRKNYREMFGVVKDDALYESISEGRRYAGQEHWLPLFYNRLETLFDYLPDAEISLDHQALEAAHERAAQVNDLYQARLTLLKSQKDITHYKPVPPETLFLGEEEWKAHVERGTILSPFAADEGGAKRARDFLDIRAQAGAELFREVALYVSALQAEKKKVYIACYSEGSKERLKTLLDGAGVKANLIILALEHGFVNDRIAVITEQDILGDRLARKGRGQKRKSDAFLREVSSLNPGDLVVHAEHGIGRFEGLETVKALGTLHDCLKLVYEGGDRLFLPVENIEMLSRFGHDEGTVQLDKLGGAGWQSRKARIKKDLLAIAGKLLEIAAARAVKKADVFDSAGTAYDEFAARFPYHETEDQQRSINEAIANLKSGRPMDRLVCGDVGFGKTEVALRAAAVVAMAGGQVAVVAPTTLLARQHTENFTRRFAGFPVRIAQLSRFVSATEAKRTKEELKEGKVQIVIGTHALLSESVEFKNLGLVIVDEEQHFGVKQKEKLKDLRRDVHVLTLTATPIPRTLQLALTGVRDMSLITTPPVDRLAVRTFVMPYDPLVVREAILREHYRGGQTFFVCPRIKDLEEMEEQVKALVPEVKIITAHGQLPPAELEARMTAFYDRQYEVLMATNIIESGLDVPTANTIIVHHADLFGLAQLYQIRGRVGRSKLRAFAYLTWKPDVLLTQTATKRLEVIGMLDSLGSGFQLASHDMDIRGAGNLLGEQQHGHIREVGVELYQQMLEEAVEAARSGAGLESAPIDIGWSPSINLGISVLIPESYVADLNVRMSLYRRLATLADENEVEAFAAELIDRFGPIPPDVENLLKLTTIKTLCKKAGIDSLDVGPKGVVVAFRGASPPSPEGVIAMMAQKAGTVRLTPDQKLVYTRAYTNPAQRLSGALSVASELASLANKKLEKVA